MNPSLSHNNQNLNAAALRPYDGEWTAKQAGHLIRRTHLGLSASDRSRALAAGSAQAAVNEIIARAENTPLVDPPSWFSETPRGSIGQMFDIQREWIEQMYSGGLLDRMKLFWSNHFAVSYDNMNALRSNEKAGRAYIHVMYQYVQQLHRSAMGDFREIVRRVSKEPAMLYYLNNYANSKEAPNEDFARELLELFTLGPVEYDGIANYTEEDVTEVARAVTGWRVFQRGADIQSRFIDSLHDAEQKTIFGKTANYDLDTLIDLIFEERKYQSARFLCRKLYCFFVSAEPNQGVINEMADYLVENNFNVSSCLRLLFTSHHFYEPAIMACRIKSPLEWYIAASRELQMTPTEERQEYVRSQMQLSAVEELLRPSNVFGWPGYNPPAYNTDLNALGHFSWISSSEIPNRWQGLINLIKGTRDVVGHDFSSIVLQISNPRDPFVIARDIAKFILPLDLSEVSIAIVESNFAGDSTLHPIVDKDFEGELNGRPDLRNFSEKEISLSKMLLGPLPWYDWEREISNGEKGIFSRLVTERLQEYVIYLMKLPAYQLI